MSDNLRRYRAIRDALAQWDPSQPQGHLARHLHTLAALSSGMVARKSTPRPNPRHPRVRWHQGREPRHTLFQVARQRQHRGGGVFFTVCGPLAESLSLADVGAGQGWQRRGPRGRRSDAPRGGERPSPAAGLAGAPRSEGALSRRPPYGPRRVGQRWDTGGSAGRVAWRWRIRRDPPATNGKGPRLVLWVPHGLPHDSVVGRRDLSSRYLGGVYQARNPHRVLGGAVYT